MFDWIAPRINRASGVTMREAVKYLPGEWQEDALMAAYKGRRAVGTTASSQFAFVEAGFNTCTWR